MSERPSFEADDDPPEAWQVAQRQAEPDDPHEPDRAELEARATRLSDQSASYRAAVRLSEAVNRLLRDAL